MYVLDRNGLKMRGGDVIALSCVVVFKILMRSNLLNKCEGNI